MVEIFYERGNGLHFVGDRQRALRASHIPHSLSLFGGLLNQDSVVDAAYLLHDVKDRHCKDLSQSRHGQKEN